MSPPRAWLASPEEAPAVAELLIAFRDHLGVGHPPDERWHAGVRRLMAGEDAEYLLGAPGEGDAPAGVAQLRFRHGLWWDAPDCLLEDLFVLSSARGAGLGRALVALALERARERGARRVELDVNDNNHAALALYRSFGFDAADARYGGENLLMRLRLEEGPP